MFIQRGQICALSHQLTHICEYSFESCSSSCFIVAFSAFKPFWADHPHFLKDYSPSCLELQSLAVESGFSSTSLTSSTSLSRLSWQRQRQRQRHWSRGNTKALKRLVEHFSHWCEHQDKTAGIVGDKFESTISPVETFLSHSGFIRSCVFDIHH